ncbi:MAG: 16S rRNA (guanine(527)-N(7))-methyltransferase RsmG [Pseudomonadota bacterium]
MTIDEKQLKAIAQIKKFYPISQIEIEKLQSFVVMLLQYNQQYNLIGESTVQDVWHRHILDSAQLLQYIPNKNLVVGDFGSGAGFPAIVLSILGVKEIHLIEKSFRKCEFLSLAAQVSDHKIIIHQKKVEEIKDLTFDIATSRAFAPLDKLIKTVKPFLKPDGYGIFLKGKSFENEINLAKKHNKFHHTAHASLTSQESKVLVINNIN